MKYIYNVIYYTYGSLYCRQELENELFDSMDTAKYFLNQIIKEESRLREDKDFCDWKIKIEKKMINLENTSQEIVEYVYDMQGKLLYDSSRMSPCEDSSFSGKFKIGDSIEISPFPWCIVSPCEIKKLGIIAGHANKEYLVYLLDNFQVIHLHLKEKALNKILISDNNLIENKILRDIQDIILSKKNNVPSEENFLLEYSIVLPETIETPPR